MKILVVEDDPRISSFLAKGLKAEGYVPVVAASGQQALAAVGIEDVDLVLLDLGLPDMDGHVLLAALRAPRKELPVIILTARHSLQDKVAGLDAGATDYITKPFAVAELLARVRAALRGREQATATELQVEDLRLDLLTKIAWRGDRRIDLAPREWALLEFFMRHPKQMLSRMQILNHVWDYGFDPGSNVVDVYVGYLRRKVNEPGSVALFHTVRGGGYRLLAS